MSCFFMVEMDTVRYEIPMALYSHICTCTSGTWYQQMYKHQQCHVHPGTPNEAAPATQRVNQSVERSAGKAPLWMVDLLWPGSGRITFTSFCLGGSQLDFGVADIYDFASSMAMCFWLDMNQAMNWHCKNDTASSAYDLMGSLGWADPEPRKLGRQMVLWLYCLVINPEFVVVIRNRMLCSSTVARWALLLS